MPSSYGITSGVVIKIGLVSSLGTADILGEELFDIEGGTSRAEPAGHAVGVVDIDAMELGLHGGLAFLDGFDRSLEILSNFVVLEVQDIITVACIQAEPDMGCEMPQVVVVGIVHTLLGSEIATCGLQVFLGFDLGDIDSEMAVVGDRQLGRISDKDNRDAGAAQRKEESLVELVKEKAVVDLVEDGRKRGDDGILLLLAHQGESGDAIQ